MLCYEYLTEVFNKDLTEVCEEYPTEVCNEYLREVCKEYLTKAFNKLDKYDLLGSVPVHARHGM